MTSCRVCSEHFIPFQPLQAVCSLKCAKRVPIIARNTLKAEKKADRAKRESLKTRSSWFEDAQREFNKYIRHRDHDQLCISCNRNHAGRWQAGHYLSVGARPELRFSESNVHKQCQPCNMHLHGNITLYRVGLLSRIGLVELERLEGPHGPMKYTIDDLRAIRDDYRKRTKEMT